MNSNQKKLLEQLALLGDVVIINKSKDGLIKAISEMDSATIELILDDEVSYQETTKTIYLEKLNTAFNQFKETDTELIPHKGKCCSEKCNFNAAGVSFIGNNSGNYLNLIIEQNNNGSIKDIYDCHKFCTDNDVKDLMKNEINITVYIDEQVNFNPSSHYLELKKECISAVNELKKEKVLLEENLITKKEIINWLNKYQSLYQSFEVPPLFFKYEDTFYWIYCSVKSLFEFIILEEAAALALNDYKKVDLNQEIQLLKWLVKYEQFHYDLILLHPDSISENGINTGVEKLHKELDTYYSIEIIKNCIDLENILDKHYYTMLNKYSTETDEEKEAQSPFDDNYDEMESLKYHLEKRGMI